MLLLKIMACLVGALFTVFGYLIYFRGQYQLINGFEKDRAADKKQEQYAKGVGLVEFAVGLCMLLAAAALLLLH